MKRFVTIFFLIVAITAYSHSGGTDSEGGHHDRKRGTYHFHHGFSAHQHYEGHCPHDIHDDFFIVSLITGASAFIFFKLSDKIKGG